ncbi:uncharacterized protein LOC144149252 [Haemaphysalis longicornis]
MAADMPKINAEALISAVAARPALWQAKHRDNKNKHRKQALWDEVAAAVAPGVADGETVQKKWKSLRDKYRRLFNLMLDAERSGASAEDMPVITWPHYEQLEFLKDTMESRPTSGNMTKAASEAMPPPPAGSLPPAVPPPHAAARAETPMEILENIVNYEDLETVSLLSDEDGGALSGDAFSSGSVPCSSVPSPSSSSVPSPSCSSVQSSCGGSALRRPSKKRKDTDDPLYTHINDISEKLAAWKPLDSDEYFAMSLVSSMRKVHDDVKLEMRMKVMQAVKDYMT